MARVTANFNIPREDVYEETVKLHRESGSFNKLLTSLVTAYHDNIEVRTVIEAKMNGVERAESKELNDLLNRMKNTIASSDILTEEGAFAGETYSEEVREGYSVEDHEDLRVGKGSTGSVGSVEGLAEEVENIKTDLKDIKDLLKGLVEGGYERKETRVKGLESFAEPNRSVKLEEEIGDEEVEIFTNVPTEVYIPDEINTTEDTPIEYVDEEESEDLLNNLLSGGVLI